MRCKGVENISPGGLFRGRYRPRVPHQLAWGNQACYSPIGLKSAGLRWLAKPKGVILLRRDSCAPGERRKSFFGFSWKETKNTNLNQKQKEETHTRMPIRNFQVETVLNNFGEKAKGENENPGAIGASEERYQSRKKRNFTTCANLLCKGFRRETRRKENISVKSLFEGIPRNQSQHLEVSF